MSLFKHTKIQRDKIEMIIDEFSPEFDTRIEASVWKQFSTRYGVIFFQFDDDERFSVRNSNGIELPNDELNKVLDQILSDRQTEQFAHLPRVKSNDKIQSVTTIANKPSKRELDRIEESIKLLDPKLPLAVQRALYNEMSQEVHAAIAGMNEMERLEYKQRLNFKAKICNDICDDQQKKARKGAFKRINEIRREVDGKLNRSVAAYAKYAASVQGKKEEKQEKKEQKREEKKLLASLNPIQILMKNAGRTDYLDLNAVAAYTAKYTEMTGEAPPEKRFKIEKTSSVEQKFG